ncbi:hypothetical protein DUNSADRAFT_11008 [Dunaliella salina]|uniref:Encoded protein n=1 Tax=Dunaliella salina TaxID=3046 RepID=A0ABQ7GEA3_DUNSA|nr:hypothetical protein DUNSADRAFT_11008 [Dunaliella salina]|eukprot:KAF5832928.1 hypothetical protein DUNSADRAFT_11008 [Dunaliella salina]
MYYHTLYCHTLYYHTLYCHLQDTMSRDRLIGISLAMGGIVWYTQLAMQEKAGRPSKALCPWI